MMAGDKTWADERGDEREAMDEVELARVRRQLPRRYRERLLRAVVREILGYAAA
jgi:hypothetical protein